MSSQDKKRKLNTGGATAFNSLLNLVAKTSPEPNKNLTTNKVEKKEATINNDPVVSDAEVVKQETIISDNTEQKIKNEEAPTQSLKKEIVQETNNPNIVSDSPTNNEASENPAYTKKENELIKKFLSKRKSKGKTSPVLIDDLLKEKVDGVGSLFGVTTTSFLCNIIEEHFKENKNTYMELISKKKPFAL